MALARWRWFDRLARVIAPMMPACWNTRDGMIDGRDGLFPRSADPYYQEGHRLGTSWRSAG